MQSLLWQQHQRMLQIPGENWKFFQRWLRTAQMAVRRGTGQPRRKRRNKLHRQVLVISSDQFSCPHSNSSTPPTCFPALWRFGDDQNCLDGSDEINCTTPCQSSQFECSGNSTACVSARRQCVVESDCPYHSDELNSTVKTVSDRHTNCEAGHFQFVSVSHGFRPVAFRQRDNATVSGLSERK